MTEMLVFDEAPQKRKTPRLIKSIKYLSSTQSIVYALRYWGHVSQKEIANSLDCSRPYIQQVEDQVRAILTEEQFPWNKSSVRKELIMLNDISSNGGLVPLKKLMSVQAFIAASRLGLHKSQNEIAEFLGCSQAHVGALERKSIAIFGQFLISPCEIAIVEMWNQIKVDRRGRKGGTWSPEARRAAKERCNTLKYKQTMSERMKRFYQTPRGIARKKEQSEEAKKRQRKWSEEPKHINKTEQKLQNLLIQWGFLYKYVGDRVLWIGYAPKSKNSLPYIRGCRNPDFIHRFFPGIIELYGDHYHKKEKLENGGDNGQSRIDHYAAFGYHALIIWEHEVKDALRDSEKALDLYNRLLEFESKLQEELKSEFGVNFPVLHHTFSNPA